MEIALQPSIIIPEGDRVYAIGDLHGHSHHLRELLKRVAKDLCDRPLQPGQQSRFVFLGDNVDRGPDSKGVMDILVSLKQENPSHIFLEGNHDKDFRDVIRFLSGDKKVDKYYAGITVETYRKTYESYGVPVNWRAEWDISEMKPLVDAVPREHKLLLETMPRSAQFCRYLLVHDPLDVFGGIDPWNIRDNYQAFAYLARPDREPKPACIKEDCRSPETILVHGHRHANFAAPPERHAHRIGLNDYREADMTRIHCAVLERNQKPRYLSYSGPANE